MNFWEFLTALLTALALIVFVEVVAVVVVSLWEWAGVRRERRLESARLCACRSFRLPVEVERFHELPAHVEHGRARCSPCWEALI